MTRGAILDIHVHLGAMDPAETGGGWFSTSRRKSPAFRWIRGRAGLPVRDEGFDEKFRALLLDAVRDASLLAGEEFSGFCAVALAFDRPHDNYGQPLDEEADFFVPDSYALRLAEALPSSGNIRARLLAGASIHPYRRDAALALREAAARGAALVKWLPTAQDIDPADARSAAFARECAEMGMPLLIHSGPEGATRDRHPAWNSPRALEPILAAGATVIAAHAGMSTLPHQCRLQDWLAMLPDWPNLYGDTAALIGLRPRKLIRILDRNLVAERLVHGSDWPVPNWPGWYWPGLPWRTVRGLSRITNPLWRDVAAKLAAGLPRQIFRQGWNLLHFKSLPSPVRGGGTDGRADTVIC